MKKKRFLSVILVIGISIAICSSAAPLTAERAGSGPTVISAGKTDRCPVCGMFVHKFPKWMAGFILQDGSRYFHCSPKCMLHNLHNVSKYQPNRTREDIKYVWVTEYYTTKQMDALDVFFVTGSTLMGPMGLDLIPVKGRDAAENLKRDYNGQLIVKLDQITDDLIQQSRRGKLK